jgi:hypothetical protein
LHSWIVLTSLCSSSMLFSGGRPTAARKMFTMHCLKGQRSGRGGQGGEGRASLGLFVCV